MGTENSSIDTRRRAKELSEAIGRFVVMTYPYLYSHSRHALNSYHIDLNMDTIVTAVRDLFSFVTGVKPRFRVHGGTAAENLALQNIQVSVLNVM